VTPPPGRTVSRKSTLLRLGFADADAAAEAWERLAGGRDGLVEPLLAIFGRAADPDLALANLVRLSEAVRAATGEDLLAELDDEGTAMRLIGVLGASSALGDHLVRHPEHWTELADPLLGSTRSPAFALRDRMLRAVGAEPDSPASTATRPDAVDALRVEYRRHLVRLAARDVAHELPVGDVAAELSDLAVATLEAALAVARQRVGAAAAGVRLAVIAMGKCGGHELNYVSDVDVVFVHAPAEGADETAAAQVASRLASELMKVCAEHTGEGNIWAVDAALRPEGKAGPLSRTLDGHVGYYERWASTWEFQALLKARAAAGDRELGQAYLDAVAPFVWRAAERDGFVEDTQAMRRRVVENIPAKEAEQELKLGVGGLRDVEFAVQLLQLVHGRTDPRLRAPDTLTALDELARGGYVGREDGEALHQAYAFLRTLEHRIQLRGLRRTHLVPTDVVALRRLGRSLGYLKEPVEQLESAWAHWRREVRRLHEKLFYRPLLSAVARIPSEEARLSPEAAEERLAALGYADPVAAMRHLEALTSGVNRSSAMQRTLMPVMLTWFAEGADPDAGLFGFRRISEALRDTPWYLRALRDEGLIAERLALVLATSQYATGLLEREPEGVRLLGGSLAPESAEELTAEMRAVVERREDAQAATAVRVVRAIRRRELFRVSAAEVLGLAEVEQVGAALSRLTDATLEAALAAVSAEVLRERGLAEAPARLAIVAMGRYGGFELSYGSDADVLFVFDPAPGVDQHDAAQYAQAVAHQLRDLLGVAGPDPALELDANLRPEGRQGPLVRSLESYAAYYARWSHVWEAQALLRADAVVGDRALREAFTAMIDPLRYPPGGLSEDDVREVRRIKGRVDAERLPRGADPQSHLKLGRGGLADIEWTVQLLQMRYADEVPGLRTPRTLEALAAAVAAGVVDAADAEVLARGWRQVSRVRNAVVLARGRASDMLPRAPRERRAVAAILGYPAGAAEEMFNDHLRATRQASAVVDRVFWGDAER